MPDLQQIYKLQTALKYWQRKYADLQSDLAISSKAPDGMPYSKTNSNSDPTQNKAVRLAETKKVIEGKMAEIQLALWDTEEIILKIEDPLLQAVVGYRSIENLSWREITSLVGGSEEANRQMYNRYLKKLKKSDK